MQVHVSKHVLEFYDNAVKQKSDAHESMAEIWANFSGGSYPEKEMEMAGSYPTEAFCYHRFTLKKG